jgi:hypothetical protein
VVDHGPLFRREWLIRTRSQQREHDCCRESR